MTTNFGGKLPLDTKHIRDIQNHLFEAGAWRDLALFMVGIDSLLRGCDLLRLRVKDVKQSDKIKSRLVIQQQKTGRSVETWLGEPTRQALGFWLEYSGKSDTDYCFTGHAKNCDGRTPITSSAYRQLVKKWVAAIGLDPSRYSTKTLRKSRARPILEAAGMDYAVPQRLLGHQSLMSTQHYINVDQEHALAISAKVQVFRSLNFSKQRSHPKPLSSKTPQKNLTKTGVSVQNEDN